MTDAITLRIVLTAEQMAATNAARGDSEISEFVRDAIAEKIGKRKWPPSRGRGRPKKSEETAIDKS